jgi:hypothetical protein
MGDNIYRNLPGHGPFSPTVMLPNDYTRRVWKLHSGNEVLQKESGRRLCYIYIAVAHKELFQRSVAPLVAKFGIHQGHTGRKGVRRG